MVYWGMSTGQIPHTFPSPRHRPPEAGSLYEAPERLLSMISSRIEQTPVVLNIVAPLGYGKTNLAAAVCRSLFSRSIWLSLTEGCTDELTFTSDLLLSIREAGLPVTGHQNPFDVFQQQPPVCLVLDNLHMLPRGTSGFVLEFFASLPENSLMVLCADEDHSLPLSRLRIDDRVLEIRIEDLTATKDELAAFFVRLGSSPSEEDLELILQKTGGWWACIRLCAISWRQFDAVGRKAFFNQFRATDRFIREFLTENIDTHLAPEHLDFLRTISVCTHIRTELAARLCGLPEDRIRTILQELASRFILLPIGHGWYRLPVILKQHYCTELDRSSRENLHRRASEWFQFQHMPKLASHHLQKAGIQSPLAPRETEILLQAAQGLSNAEIGERLFISQGTVKWHMNRILEKLDCSNRTAAVETARRNGFISD